MTAADEASSLLIPSSNGTTKERREWRNPVWIVCIAVVAVMLYTTADQVPRDVQQSSPVTTATTTDNKSIVHYDGRSLFVNNERVLLLGGSIHPFRATPSTWERVLDDMRAASLNLVTIYVNWSVHQPFSTSPFDGSLLFREEKGGEVFFETTMTAWSLADAIRAAGARGFYVHVRLGPYICAEASYGGIPEWVPLSNSTMAMRRPSLPWMRAMETYLRTVVAYLRENALFIHQGGPIILGQVENELGPASDTEDTTYWAKVNAQGNFVEANDPTGVRTATVQDYADWAGALARKLEPHIEWTMCLGISSNTTILTYNGFLESSKWLDNHGGRIQVDQPAMWSEDEGGFQLWGEDPLHPRDYVWGVTAKAQAYSALQWFARGGTHLNFYMWWGGYNRGRVAAAAITNMYAVEAPICPSGEPRQPKYDHLRRLLGVIQEVSPVLLDAPTALNHSQALFVKADDGTWVQNEKVRMFTYNATTTSVDGSNDQRSFTSVLFVENNCNMKHTVRIPGMSEKAMDPSSSSVFVDGVLRFDSAAIEETAFQYKRWADSDIAFLQDCRTWSETVPAETTVEPGKRPVEQTVLNLMGNTSSDYARYVTSFNVGQSCDSADLLITTQTSNAFTVFLDNTFVGQAENITRKEDNDGVQLLVSVGPLYKGTHKLVLLSESLGYSNLMGRWGGRTGAKKKGVIGDVVLVLSNETRIELHSWISLPGLHRDSRLGASAREIEAVHCSNATSSGTIIGEWTQCSFQTPVLNSKQQQLYVEVTSGRGHFWLNGFDLGRYWNITQNGSLNYTQSIYLLPWDYMSPTHERNELLQFNSLPTNNADDNLASCKLFLSWAEHSSKGYFPDAVGASEACWQGR